MNRTAKKFTQAEWLEEGKKKFGENPDEWKFQCPICGHVQGDREYQECKNCHYKSYGLFHSHVTVIAKDGEEVHVLDFADDVEGETHG